MSDEVLELADDLLDWSQQREWFVERDIPWRMGVLLHGEPGCGKTAFVRAMAEKLDYPIYSFDLATLYNDELRREWSRMLSDAPCIAIFEDFDAIFDGRKALCDVTFDCVLNCLDGVERVDGLLTFITTNNGDRIDSAIADCGVAGEEDADDVCSRPGRIDRCVRLGRLTYEGRCKIAARILFGFDRARESVLQDSDGDTGAQFQERCVREALRERLNPREAVGRAE